VLDCGGVCWVDVEVVCCAFSNRGGPWLMQQQLVGVMKQHVAADCHLLLWVYVGWCNSSSRLQADWFGWLGIGHCVIVCTSVLQQQRA